MAIRYVTVPLMGDLHIWGIREDGMERHFHPPTKTWPDDWHEPDYGETLDELIAEGLADEITKGEAFLAMI